MLLYLDTSLDFQGYKSKLWYSLEYGTVWVMESLGYGTILLVASLGYGTVWVMVQSWLWRVCVVANLGCAEFGLCWSLGCGRVWLVAVWVVAVWVMASLGCGSLGYVVASTIHHVFRHQADSTTKWLLLWEYAEPWLSKLVYVVITGQ